MSSKSAVDTIMDEIDARIKQWCDYTLKRLNQETSKAMDAAYTDFGIYQQRIIYDIFYKAVDEFYSAYEPNTYERTYGLFDVLDLESNVDEYGMIVTGAKGYGDLFDAEKMHKDRKGNDLFNKVFMHGWHGGAEGIAPDLEEEWGAHPSPGTPYYRTPPNIYSYWGNRAVQTKSPYKIFREHLMAIERGEMLRVFKKISQEHNDSAVARVQKEANETGSKIFK